MLILETIYRTLLLTNLNDLIVKTSYTYLKDLYSKVIGDVSENL